MRNRLFPGFVIVAMLIFTVAIYNQLPEQIPAHWSINGEVDRYEPKTIGAWMLPAIAALLVLARGTLRRIDPRRAAYEQFESSYYFVISAVVLLLGVIHVLVLGTALGWGVSINQFMLIVVSLLLALVANETPRFKPNWFVGIRTPWTLANADVWRETHQVGGRILFIGALITLLIGIFAPSPLGVAVSIGVWLGSAALTLLVSYRVYQRRVQHNA